MDSSSHALEFPSSQSRDVCRGTSLLQTSSYSGSRRQANLEISLASDEQTQKGTWSMVAFGTAAIVLVIATFTAIMFCFHHDVTEQSKEIHPRALKHLHRRVSGSIGTESTNSARSYTPRESTDAGDPPDDPSDDGDYDLSEILGVGHVKGAVERTNRVGDEVTKKIETSFGSWKLLQQILGALAQFWAALIFMYWSLLHNPEDLMNCNAHPNDQTYSVMVRHLCNYTYACLRGFPILAANMVLVLMIRILVQNRIYYSFLEVKLVVDFADSPIYYTYWPWLTGASIVQGGMHFLLKMWYDDSKIVYVTYVTIARRFVLPGFIFFSFLFRYADIENTLIPLNRIVEEDYTKNDRHCPWFAEVQAVYERVLAFDVRHYDVVGRTEAAIGRPPTIRDIIQNLADNYDHAHRGWQKRIHKRWGLFRSMWPAAVLVDSRLDRSDPDTRAWLQVFAILLGGSLLTSGYSIYSLFRSGSDAVASGWVLKDNRETIAVDTEALLIDVVLVWHALFIVLFLYNSVRNMFYRAIEDITPEAIIQEGALDAAQRANSRRSNRQLQRYI